MDVKTFMQQSANAYSSGFNMLDYGPNCWLDISNPAGYIPDGSHISTYLDLSGFGANFHQVSFSRQHERIPNTQNGLAIARTLSSLDNYTCVKDYITAFSDTWFFVFKPSQAGNNNGTLLGAYGDDGSKLIMVRTDNDATAGQGGFFARGLTGGLEARPTYVDSPSLLVLTRTSSGSNGTITFDYNGVTGSVSGVYATTTYDNDLDNFPILGSQPKVSGMEGTSVWSGDFYEKAHMNGVLSAPDKATIKAALKEKWDTV